MNLIEEVEEKRRALGLSKAEVARQLKAPTSQNYNNWVYRNSMPKQFYDAAYEFLGTSASNITGALPIAGAVSNITHAPPIRIMIPVISWVQAGAFCENNVLELHEVDEWLPCPVHASDKAFGLRVKGDSMTSPHRGERSYPEGIIIYVDPEAELSSGRRVIAKSVASDEATFKTYIEDNGLKYLIPINPQFPRIEMNADVRICGVIIGSYWAE